MVKKRDMNNKASFSKRISFLNARMTSTLSVSLVLFILGIMVLMGFLATNLSRHVKENIGFSIVLNESAGERQVHQLQRMLERSKYVKAAQYISKEDALKEVMIELGENPEDVLGVNPLQSSIEVKLKADYANTDSLAVIEKNLRGQVIVSDILYQKDLIQSVNDNMSRIGLVLLALAIVLMLISFALISNTSLLQAFPYPHDETGGGYTGIHSSALYRFQCDQRYRCIGNSYVVAFGLHILSDVRDGELHDPAVCSHDGIGLFVGFDFRDYLNGGFGLLGC